MTKPFGLWRNCLPLFSEDSAAEKWATEAFQQYADYNFSTLPPENFHSFTPTEFSSQEDKGRFVNALVLADWLSYAPPLYGIADRCSFARMNKIFHTFEEGFRVFTCQINDETMVPVGYTGWYPLDEKSFQILEKNPETLTNRGQIHSVPTVDLLGAYIYLFNFSVVSNLKHTDLSKKLLESYAEDLSHFKKRGLANVTVSADGQRVSQRFGMKKMGCMTHMGETEDVFAVRFDEPIRRIKLHPKQKSEPV